MTNQARAIAQTARLPVTIVEPEQIDEARAARAISHIGEQLDEVREPLSEFLEQVRAGSDREPQISRGSDLGEVLEAHGPAAKARAKEARIEEGAVTQRAEAGCPSRSIDELGSNKGLGEGGGLFGV